MRQIDQQVAAVRDFNRFYTRQIGALGNAHLGSGYSLTDVRVLYELAHHDQLTASEIAATLDLDAGYLSRMLRWFKRQGFVATQPGPLDRRQTLLRLTAAGRRAFAPLEERAQTAVAGMLQPLGPAAQRNVVDAMHMIRESLDPVQNERPSAAPANEVTLRPPRAGGLGWIVYRHGVLYAEEYGYDERFEAIVARIVAEFVENYDAKRERCWVAERRGEIVGSVFVVAKSKRVAKLRLLLVEPSARGLGLGRRLVDEVIAFARKAGYTSIVLWTQSELTAARRIYQAVGFRLTGRQRHKDFSRKMLTAETWELDLGSS